MTNYSLRPSREDDRPAIRVVTRHAWEAAYTHIYTPSEINGLFDGSLAQHGSWVRRRRDRAGAFVATVEDRVVGYIGYALLHDGDGEVTNLYLDPAYHGQGIGKALWDKAVAALRELKCQTVWVWVLAKAAALQFYLRQGCIPREVGTYTVGTHGESALGCVLILTHTALPPYTAWLHEYLLHDSAWTSAYNSTFPTFLRQYTLHDSTLIGLWLSDGEATLLFDWDIVWANWRQKRIDLPEGAKAYLLVRLPKIYQVIGSDVEMQMRVLDRAESRTIAENELKLWSQLLVAQTLIDSESTGYILDDTLHRTALIGLQGDTTYLFHTARARFLCLNTYGDPVRIPNV